MSSWNSVTEEVVYEALGWIAFVSWSFGFYPQILLNYNRKSVVGLNFDFPVLNLTKHTSYGIYNTVLFFSPTVQRQYREKYGFDQMIPVAANDVAFSAHLVLLTLVILFQISMYERGNQKISKVSLGITSAVWVLASVCFFMAWQSQSWLWLISVFNSIQVFMTFIKYIPQVYLNFERQSTVGWSIGFILLDLLGGVTSFGQMAMQSIDQSSWKNFSGNIGKPLLCLVSIFFDLIFLVQHYVLYPPRKEKISPAKTNEVESTPLVKPPAENI